MRPLTIVSKDVVAESEQLGQHGFERRLLLCLSRHLQSLLQESTAVLVCGQVDQHAPRNHVMQGEVRVCLAVAELIVPARVAVGAAAAAVCATVALGVRAAVALRVGMRVRMRSLREEVHGGRAAGLQRSVHADVHHRQIESRRGAVGLHLEMLRCHVLLLLLVMMIAMSAATAATAVVAVVTRVRISILRLRRAAIAVLIDLSATATTILLLLLLLTVLLRAEVGPSIGALCSGSTSPDPGAQSAAIAQVRVHLHGGLNLGGRCVRRLNSCYCLLRSNCCLLLQCCE